MIRERPASVDWRGHALALGVGAAGGALFFWLQMPLAWMLGSMIFVSAAAIGGLRPALDRRFRSVMVSILGVFLGSAFSPEVADRMGQWAAALGILTGFVVVGSLLSYVFLRRVGGFDPITAYFSSTPGGLGEMVLASEEMGGDSRKVSLVHTIRVISIILIIPFWFRLVLGADVPSIMPEAPGVDAAPVDWLILVACAALGWPLASLCRVPAAALVGPMILSALVHLLGLTAVTPPPVPVAAAQLVLGAAVGSRFVGTAFSMIWRVASLALGTSVLLLGLAVLITLASADMIGIRPEAMILVLAPGGLAEMSLIALALGIDTAFVSTMHICRIMMIVVLGPSLFRIGARRSRETGR